MQRGPENKIVDNSNKESKWSRVSSDNKEEVAAIEPPPITSKAVMDIDLEKEITSFLSHLSIG